MKTSVKIRAGWWRVLPVVLLVAAAGCLPDDAVRQTFGDSILTTVATIVQTTTWLVFNTLFGLI
jgi:hypothetical protein